MGKFVKGQKKTGGRTKGVVNKDSRMVLDAIEAV